MSTGIGERINKILERRDWTQTYLAKRIGISKSVMSRIIAGTKPVNDDLLLRITSVLEVSSDYLLGIEKKGAIDSSTTNYIINKMVNKYKLDLSIDGEPERLEQLIKLYSDFRTH